MNSNSLLAVCNLNMDIKLLIFQYLDNKSLAQLAQTCRYFGGLVRNVISFRGGQLRRLDCSLPRIPPFLNYRAGVAIGTKFYIPLMSDSPFCYIFDLESETWTVKSLNLKGIDRINPQVTCAVAVGKKIYLVGGRYLKSYTLSNGMIEIDTDTFDVKIINDYTGTPPRPRHEHSVDVVNNRYLVVFGGLCYNSVGENDVFVYDIFDNRWFVPPIGGHLPHLRFGHASAVIGHNLYIHGGSQLDNDSSYIVYDDLYKLDCQTWEWFKYEHPEVEKYLRQQTTTSQDNSPPRTHIIATTGDSPLDRFQAYMCSYGHKLIIFGGHSIREDESENEILCSYPLDEVSIFSTKRNAWSNMHSIDTSGCDTLTVSDMSAAVLPFKSRSLRIYMFAGKKEAEMTRSTSSWTDQSQSGSNKQISSQSNSSSSYDSNQSPTLTQQHGVDGNHNTLLPSIVESAYLNEPNNEESEDIDGVMDGTDGTDGTDGLMDGTDGDSAIDGEKSKTEIESDGSNDAVMESLDKMTMDGTTDKTKDPARKSETQDDSENSVKIETGQGEERLPRNTSKARTVMQHIKKTEPDLQEEKPTDDEKMYTTGGNTRPPLSCIQNKSAGPSGTANPDLLHSKTSSSSSHSSGSSSGGNSRNARRNRKILPCAIVLELIE